MRKKVMGTSERPRLTVYRSNKHIYAQVIDDTRAHTLAFASTLEGNDDGATPKERAKAVGRLVAGKMKQTGVTKVTFDRGGFQYHGRVQAVADGAREGGLEF